MAFGSPQPRDRKYRTQSQPGWEGGISESRSRKAREVAAGRLEGRAPGLRRAPASLGRPVPAGAQAAPGSVAYSRRLQEGPRAGRTSRGRAVRAGGRAGSGRRA